MIDHLSQNSGSDDKVFELDSKTMVLVRGGIING